MACTMPPIRSRRSSRRAYCGRSYAVAWAAFFNFIAFLFFGLHVAETVGIGIVDADIIDARVIFGALMGAIAGT